MRHFWTEADQPPQIKIAEAVPVLLLIGACVWLTAQAEPVMRYTTATARSLHTPTAYIDAVLSTRPLPGPTRPAVMRQDGAQ